MDESMSWQDLNVEHLGCTVAIEHLKNGGTMWGVIDAISSSPDRVMVYLRGVGSVGWTPKDEDSVLITVLAKP